MNYTLGIDCGGTFIKAALFDHQGNLHSLHRENVSVISEQAGYAERDMVQLWQVCADVVKQAVEKSGVSAKQIKAVVVFRHRAKGRFCLINSANRSGGRFSLPTNARLAL